MMRLDPRYVYRFFSYAVAQLSLVLVNNAEVVTQHGCN